MHMMLIHDVTEVIVASSSSDGDGSWFGLLFLLSGPAYFLFMYRRYRNTDKRHLHERETAADVDNLEMIDTKIDSVKGSRKSKMTGANHREVNG